MAKGKGIRSDSVMGLVFTPQLGSENVTSIEMTFEPSVGIMARRVDKLGLDIRSFRVPLHRSIKQVVIPSIAMNFQKYGRPRWPNLSPDTEQKRLSEGSGWAILDRSGALKNTMKQIGIWHIDAEKALLANLPDKVWYGVVHQMGVGDPNAKADMWFDPVLGREVNVGAGAGQINIPARPFVVLQPQDEKAIDEVFLHWLDERIAAAGFGYSARQTMGGLF